MKITILGGAGTRTPLILRAMVARQDRIGLTDLALMDIDEERLHLMALPTARLERSEAVSFNIARTTDLQAALSGADVVITTFRVGGSPSRVVDERVPLNHGVLGQETTGPGGFAMAMRTIPVLLNTIELMRRVSPDAWLVNFANPAGMLAEAAIRAAGWQRVVGICDAPHTMRRVAAALLDADTEEIFLDYFGLNHLGWVRAVTYDGQNILPRFVRMMQAMERFPGLPFHPDFIAALGLIPNEYLHYYYHRREAVENILRADQTRGEQVMALNTRLFDELRRLEADGDLPGIEAAYRAYIRERGETYMTIETGDQTHPEGFTLAMEEVASQEGYAGVALGLVEALTGGRPREMVLNIPNRGAIPTMDDDDVVEVPTYVARGFVRPLAVGDIPDHCLGLIKQVKAYERLTIAAAVEGSYARAVEALAIHPLVPDYATARAILDEYRQRHGPLFPKLE
jgi:6-phospho-beta-glucosidase